MQHHDGVRIRVVGIRDENRLLTMPTTRSGTIVFMEKVSNTRNAAA
jgi:hypothetical protein